MQDYFNNFGKPAAARYDLQHPNPTGIRMFNIVAKAALAVIEVFCIVAFFVQLIYIEKTAAAYYVEKLSPEVSVAIWTLVRTLFIETAVVVIAWVLVSVLQDYFTEIKIMRMLAAKEKSEEKSKDTNKQG